MSESPVLDVESGEEGASITPTQEANPSELSDHYLFGNISDLSDLEEQDISDSEVPTFTTTTTTTTTTAAAAATHILKEQEIQEAPPALKYDGKYDDEPEYEGEDLEGGSRKKRPAKKRKVQTPKIDKDTSLILAHVGPEAQERVLAVRREFNLAMKSITSTRKKQKDTDALQTETIATDFRSKMREAAERDLVSFTKQKPAVHKLRLLPMVSKQLDRSELQDVFLDHHILDGFQSWLEPLPDGSLPSYDIRYTLFQLLLKLPITTDHLRECSIGPLIVFYTKAPKETPEIKRMAQECVTKWSRPILNISDSYRDARLEERKVDLNAVKSKQVLRRDPTKAVYNASKKSDATSVGQRARLPVPNATGYLVRPSSNVTDTDVRRKKNEAFRSLNQTLSAHRNFRR